MVDRGKEGQRKSNVFLNDKKRFCARSIIANFKTKPPCVKIRNFFWAASRATSSHAFNNNKAYQIC